MTDSTILHVAAEFVVVVLGGWWIKRVQARTDGFVELQLKVARLETAGQAQAEVLAKLDERVSDVQTHMLRREDVEMIRRAMQS